MELRGFGKNRRRSWYSARRFTRYDILSMVVCALLLVLSIILTAVGGSRFYNPFV